MWALLRLPQFGGAKHADDQDNRSRHCQVSIPDAADAEAIWEAVTRANVRFVATKTPEQQSGMVLHRTRHLFIRQQTSVINAIRAHLAEFGIVAPVGRKGVEELLLPTRSRPHMTGT